MRATLQQALEALKSLRPYTNTSAVACRGDKCREIWCVSCNGEEDAENAAMQGYNAAVNASAAITAIKQTLAQPETCIWTPMGDDTPDSYDTACGQSWSFIDGGPLEHNCTFCHGCGRRTFCHGCGKPVEVKE